MDVSHWTILNRVYTYTSITSMCDYAIDFMYDNLKEQSANFYIGLFDTPEYDVIWTENGSVNDSFIKELLTSKECSKRVKYMLDTF